MRKIIYISFLFLFNNSLLSQNEIKYDSAFYKTYNYMRVDNYYDATTLIDSVLIKIDNKTDLFEKARFLTLRAAVYENLEDFEKSKKLNLEAMNLFNSVKNEYYYNWTLIILMSNYVKNGNYKDFFKLLPSAKSRNKDDFFIFFLYQTELEAYYKQKKYKTIINVIDKMIIDLNTTKFNTDQYKKETYNYKAMFKIFKAFSLMKTNKQELAKPLINELLKLDFEKMFWKDEEILKYEPKIYKYKCDLLLEDKRLDSLKYYKDKYTLKSDKFLKFLKTKISKTKRTMGQILEDEKKANIENSNLKIDKQKKNFLIISIASLVFIIFSLWFGFNKFKNANIIKKLNYKLEQNIRQLKQKNVKNQELILLNERNIFSKTIQISTLRDKIKKINLELTQAIKNGDNINISTLFRIENSLNSVITENEIWDEFKIQFENMRPLFFKKLKEINPNLSINDLKHCAYVAVNLKTKDVANLIYISPRSVETIRYRLRKKLNIPKEVKLYDFLHTIDSSEV